MQPDFRLNTFAIVIHTCWVNLSCLGTAEAFNAKLSWPQKEHVVREKYTTKHSRVSLAEVTVNDSNASASCWDISACAQFYSKFTLIKFERITNEHLQASIYKLTVARVKSFEIYVLNILKSEMHFAVTDIHQRVSGKIIRYICWTIQGQKHYCTGQFWDLGIFCFHNMF